ncbi:hypothetical protein B0H67DRAFT_583079 [Lasiosphaeris hirsuta]|uniref:Uncharacterized protein n=1 Tax=Lasiosphaeris hirsuta TaxID=260670 RepID=A0AA40A7I0_9PEZI|nr:hypothetical protein B0H67DRAFT_583079 [Lasiosphaeris hirsuta]
MEEPVDLRSATIPNTAPELKAWDRDRFGPGENRPLSDTWFYPAEIEGDLRGTKLPDRFVDETLATAWEFTRCIIPHFTNWARYIAYVRLIAISTVAEYNGALIDAVTENTVLGYNIKNLLHDLFGGVPIHEEMSREFRTNLLFTADKSCDRRNSDLFHRYVNLLGQAPRTWFRLRDCDGLARFTIAASLVCNGIYDRWFTEQQLQILGEISLTMYDAVAYHKHRAEGEVHNTFAYAGDEVRKTAYHRCRETLWALDALAAKDTSLQCAISFTRYIGGPIHMMMRRYRFVDDGLTIGKPETEEIIWNARQHVKLWNRVDLHTGLVDNDRHTTVTAHSDELLFPGLVELLDDSAQGHCNDCIFRPFYGAETSRKFGGVELCQTCKLEWQEYLGSIAARAAEAFPASDFTGL